MEPHPVKPISLSPQMLKILYLVSKGKSHAEISRELAISEHTVRHYLYKAYDRLGVHKAPEAVTQATRLNLLPLDDGTA